MLSDLPNSMVTYRGSQAIRELWVVTEYIERPRTQVVDRESHDMVCVNACRELREVNTERKRVQCPGTLSVVRALSL